MINTAVRVLLDTGIFAHSEFTEGAAKLTSVRWGDKEQYIPVHGFTRKTPDRNSEYQAQIDAILTVGRLIREGRVQAYEYSEIHFERMSWAIGFRACNALDGCTIQTCPPALQRSKFRQGNFMEVASKGGRKDRKAGIAPSPSNQIAFFSWLCSLTQRQIDALESVTPLLGGTTLSAFELESWRDIPWFQFLCHRSGSEENYPDVFHIWTAERNGIDFLTLDEKLQKLVSRVTNEKNPKINIRTRVMRPLDLLLRLGIDHPDRVPVHSGRFYSFFEKP